MQLSHIIPQDFLIHNTSRGTLSVFFRVALLYRVKGTLNKRHIKIHFITATSYDLSPRQ